MFREIRETNVARSKVWHENAEPWNAADWGNALAGECGELCNEIKKFRRTESGIKGKAVTPRQANERLRAIADEAADTFLYLDLVCAFFGIDLQLAIARKFNEVSVREGFTDFELPEIPMDFHPPIKLGLSHDS